MYNFYIKNNMFMIIFNIDILWIRNFNIVGVFIVMLVLFLFLFFIFLLLL